MKTKTLLLGFLLVAMPALLQPTRVAAHDFVVDGIYYNVVGPSEVAVTCRGCDSEGLSYSGNLVIPETVEYEGNNYTVTTIGPDAFFKCKQIGLVSIPSTITDLYWDAFMESASSIVVPDLETWCGITFYVDCSYHQGSPDLVVYTHHLIANQDIEHLVIPTSITEIGDFTFYNTGNIRSVVIPNQVTQIGEGAFAACDHLESVRIGPNVEFIGSGAFDILGAYYWGDLWNLESEGIIDEVTCLAVEPPVLESKYCFNTGIYRHTVLRVPEESMEAYRAAEYWSRFENIEGIPGIGFGDVNGDGTLSIGDVTRMIDVLLSGEEASPYADVNGDGRVSIADVTALINMLLNGN